MAKAQNWPADAVERRAVSALKPYAKNSRTHSESQIQQIAASIREFGFTVPVLVDPKGGIIAGHGRVMAAASMGLEEVPVMVARGWTAAQKRAYVIADNKLAMNAGWDEDILAGELRALGADGFDLALTGFDASEVAGLMATGEGLTDPDEVPEPPVDPVTRAGDVWVLGDHRLICGDSTDAGTVARVLDGAKPHLMVTDPPYGVDYDPEWRNRVKRQDGSLVGAKATGVVHNDNRADWLAAWELFPGDVIYVWHGGLLAATVMESIQSAGFAIRSQIIWAKQQKVIGRGDYHWQHEPCWYAVRKGKTGRWAGDRKQSTIWEIGAPSGWMQKTEGEDAHTVHSTQKPVECMKRPIENNSQPGDAVYDPFLGSGTTMIAAEMTGRRCYGIELSPAYCDVIVKRWQDFTGREAVREPAPILEAAE